MNAFHRCHPVVILNYFVVLFIIHLLMFDPVLLGISFFSQSVLCLYQKGIRAGVVFAGRCLLFVLVCTGINALINHRGVSVLFFMGGLPVTVESMFYGVMTGLLLADSVLLFSSYHYMMTSEKLMCLFGNRFPSLSLIFSMILGLVPKIKRDYRKIRENHGMSPGIVSSLIGMSLEDSLERGISMRYRGYGTGKRTSIYHRAFAGYDSFVLVTALVFAALCIGCYFGSQTGTRIYPYIEYQCDRGGIFAYVSAFLLLNLPMIWNAKEEIKWKRIVSKI